MTEPRRGNPGPTEHRTIIAPGVEVIDDGQRRPDKKPHAAENAASWVLARPGRSIAALTVLAATLELAQHWPAPSAGIHALGEVTRNLTYALLAALLFHWVIVQLPEQRRRHAIYSYRKLELEWLVKVGLSELACYRRLSSPQVLDLDVTLDPWDRESIFNVAEAISRRYPEYFTNVRGNELASHILVAQDCLDACTTVLHLLDPDVAKELGVFPAMVGVRRLQPPPPDSDLQVRWQRDAHIVWELLEGSRRLWAALRANAPTLDLDVESTATGVIFKGVHYAAHIQRNDYDHTAGVRQFREPER